MRPHALAALFLLAAAGPALARGAVTVSKCIWRNDVVCDASPAFIIGQLPKLTSNPEENPLAVAALQVRRRRQSHAAVARARGTAAAGDCAAELQPGQDAPGRPVIQ
jgi:hypothetical protein